MFRQNRLTIKYKEFLCVFQQIDKQVNYTDIYFYAIYNKVQLGCWMGKEGIFGGWSWSVVRPIQDLLEGSGWLVQYHRNISYIL